MCLYRETIFILFVYNKSSKIKNNNNSCLQKSPINLALLKKKSRKLEA